MGEILFPIAALAVNAIVQAVAFRSRRGAQFFRSIVEGFVSGAILLTILEFASSPSGASSTEYWMLALLVNGPTYFCLSYCAYNFVQLGQTSIRIRIYSEIAANPSGISVEEMKREYDDDALIRGRLQRLTESGDLVESNGHYILGRKRFLYIANILFAAKRFLLGKGSEFH